MVRSSSTHVLVALAAAAAAGALGSLWLVDRHPPNATRVTEVSAAPLPSSVPMIAALSPTARTEDEQNTIAVFAATARSCVFVTQQQVVTDFLGGNAHEVPAGSGSGFLWDDAGHVVTNFHVVAQAERLTVTLQDQKTYEAKVVGIEPRKDIAVLKIDAPRESLPPIARHPGRVELEVGQKVLAIGNPFGLDQTLTTGIISALGRQVEGIGGVKIREMIQTDAAINPGNSGGPLIDSSGRLIGINTMIFSRSGASAGIGFAVPVQTIARVVPQLIRNGRVEQVGLGIEIDPQQRVERRHGLSGVVVIAVLPNTPAAESGLLGLTQTRRGIALGDVITALDGKPVKTYDDLYALLDGRHAKERVKVTVDRQGKAVTLELPLVALQ